MDAHHKINYIEIPVKNIILTKQFFSEVFAWSFVDYGPDYIGISKAGIDGGFFLSDTCVATKTGSVLVVLYSKDLAATEAAVIAAGGGIVKAIFEFPGGRRFHFSDLCGNEYAVWSDK